MARCSDPTFAPPESCIVVNNTQPLIPPGKLCAWGAGDTCQPCAAGALCPGGAQLLTLPGYWAPSTTSPPSDITACPAPLATTRCPGALTSVAADASACGAGFKGQACAACAGGYFPSAGSCAPCPASASSLQGLLTPLLIFLGGLAALGLLLLLLLFSSIKIREARHSVAGGGASPAAPATLLGTAPDVAQFMVWTWIAAQGVAVLFAQAKGLAPPEFTALYGAVATLQLKGVTLDPACFDSGPFASLWACVAVVGLCGVGGLLLTHNPCARHRHAGAALYLILLVLLLGHGAITTVLADTLTCRPAAPMTLFDYALAVSDGRAMREALGQGAPPLADLRAAAANPRAPALVRLVSLMRSTSIPVSTQASNAFQVCREGPHLAAWWAALAMTALFTLGFPSLGLAALWRVGKLKGARRAWARLRAKLRGGAGGGLLLTGAALQSTHPAAATSTSAASTPLGRIHGALDVTILREKFAWVSFLDMYVLSFYTGMVGLSARASRAPEFMLVQACIAAVALGYIAFLCQAQPFLPAHAWKRSVTAGLHGLTALTAALNAIVFAQGSEAQEAIVLGYIPLCYATVLFLTLLVSFWFNGVKFGLGAAPSPSEKPRTLPNPHQAAAAAGESAEIFATSCPLAAVAGEGRRGRQKKRQLWSRFTRPEDGDVFWHCPATSQSEYVLPTSATTSCGWSFNASLQRWEHAASGAASASPPPLDEAEAGALIASAAAPPLDEAEAAALIASAQNAATPLVAAPLPEQPQWSLLCHDDGSRLWHCAATARSALELPLTAGRTDCGWSFEPRAGEWQHAASGASRRAPLPAAEAHALVTAAEETSRPRQEPGSEPVQGRGNEPHKRLESDLQQGRAPHLRRANPRQYSLTARNGAAAQAQIQRGERRVYSAAELLERTRAAVALARVTRIFEGGAMTRVHAATLLQLRWRQLKAHRVRSLWKKVALLDAGLARGAAVDHYEARQGDMPMGGGGVKRTSSKTGAAYYLHLESGRTSWEPSSGE